MSEQVAMQQSRAGTPWRVLLADDHAMEREALSQILRRLDPTLQVSLAESVDEVLAILRADPEVSLLLLGCHARGMDGVDTVRQLKRDFPKVQIGIISGYVANKDVAPLIAAGSIGVFLKSMSGPSLLMAIKLAMSGSAYVPSVGDEIAGSEHAPASAARAVPLPDLNDRQRQVLGYVVGGSPNKEIARKLGLSEVTIKIHVASLCQKFSVASRTQLATVAMSAGIRPA